MSAITRSWRFFLGIPEVGFLRKNSEHTVRCIMHCILNLSHSCWICLWFFNEIASLSVHNVAPGTWCALKRALIPSFLFWRAQSFRDFLSSVCQYPFKWIVSRQPWVWPRYEEGHWASPGGPAVSLAFWVRVGEETEASKLMWQNCSVPTGPRTQ